MDFQVADAVIFGIGGAVLVAIFLSVALGARAPAVPYEQVAKRGYRIRNYWFGLLIIGAIVALIYTIPRFPYASARLASYGPSANPMQVQVHALQWAWQVQPSTLPAGRVVEFHVTSGDVNHDFAIYDPSGHIVGQVQAMPGYTNLLVMRFDKPGMYQIRCLELCGQYHHQMVRGFEVS